MSKSYLQPKWLRLFALITVVLGLILCFVPTKIAPVCPIPEGGHPMACYWGGLACQGIAYVTLALGVILFVLTWQKRLTPHFQAGLGAGKLLLGALLYLVPVHLIGGCHNPQMQCNLHTIPTYKLFAVLLVILGVVYCVLAFLDRGNPSHD